MRTQRAGHEKSRNGCLTCKIRRVKCDETKPHCRKCTESGRKCEGPVVHQIRFIHDQTIIQSTRPVPQLEVSLLTPQRSEDERRAFHYFINHAAPIFAGAVDARFWKDLVPRLAQSYNFVWDAVVCLSYLLEHVPNIALTTTPDSAKVTKREHRQALRWYNRAIVNVRQLAERGQIDDSVIALSYILFASVEFQQRNVKTGTDLIQRCSKILTENLMSPYPRGNSSAGQAVHQVLTPFVLKKAVLIATLGKPQWDSNDEASNPLRSRPSRTPLLDEARVQFQSLMLDCYEIIRLADIVANITNYNPDKVLFLSRRQPLLDKLMQWKVSLHTTSDGTPDQETDRIRSYLLIYWAVCYISLAVCVSPHQIVFDHYTEHFAEMVEHAALYLSHGAGSANGQPLSTFDRGVTPALFFCVTKCRNPKLRREALRLMSQAPRQEPFWAFIAPDRVAAKIISVEEGVYQGSFSKTSSASQSPGLPPEERRFAYVSVVARQIPGGKQRQALELSRFEFATDGSTKLVYEYAWLDEEEEL